MKKLLYFVLPILLMFSLWLLYVKYSTEKHEKEHKEWLDKLQSTASKNVTVYTDILSIGNSSDKRTVAVYLPEDYASDTVRYPVFYFFDGQAIFDEKVLEGDEWRIDEILDSLGSIDQKAIAIAMYNSANRDSEYQPNYDSKGYDESFTGKQHCEWIVKKLKPWVDKSYRTRPDPMNTIVGGASFGGLMSYYILTEYPAIFGGAIVLSPSFWVNEKSTGLDTSTNINYLYLSAGEKERGIVNGAKELNKKLLKTGAVDHYRFEIEEGEIHRNMAWRKMVQKAIPWMLNRIDEQSTR